MPPQSPSRYIPAGRDAAARYRPVAPAVSKSLHSRCGRSSTLLSSGCPRSLQVATFALELFLGADAVRLPPQSPSRYIPAPQGAQRGIMSGCPRSLQVATFQALNLDYIEAVRLPPQSPSRYIPNAPDGHVREGPVAPAVSKSLHSPTGFAPTTTRSGCPRSLQVATFTADPVEQARTVRLPPQSPSRYIPLRVAVVTPGGPVAPAVSKSLHSRSARQSTPMLSGCPRSLQVATFIVAWDPDDTIVRLPPQSPSRYILPRWGRPPRYGPVAPAVSKSLHSSRTELSVRLEHFRLRQRIDPLVQGHSS